MSTPQAADAFIARRPKVGLIRGAYLSQFEMQTLEVLMDRVDFEAYQIAINRFDTRIIRIPVKRLRCIDDPVTLFSRKLGFWFNLFLQATNGRDYHHFGLVEALAGKDIAHTMETFNAFSHQALQAKRRHGVRLAVTVWENRPFAAERFEAKRRMKYEVIRGTDVFLAITERAARCLEMEGADPGRIRVCPPGVDLERFAPRPRPERWARELGIAEGDLVFLSVAALLWEKGVYDILHAFLRLRARHPGRRLKLLYAGSGPEGKRLQGLIERHGLSDAARITRFPYERMHEAYNLADAFILASAPRPGWLEQFGYVLIEALASGLRVITTQSGSIPEVVGDCGLLVPPSDFLALADAMEAVLLDPRRAEREKLARARAEACYDRSRNAARLLEAYGAIL